MADRDPSSSDLPPATGPARSARRPRYDYGAPAAGPAAAATSLATPVDFALVLRQNPRLWLVLALVLAGAAGLFFQNFQQLVSVWWEKITWSHGFAVPALAALLLYFHWDALKHARVKQAPAGLWILIFGVLSEVLFRVTGQYFCYQLAFIVVLYGATLYVLGWDAMKVLWLPIAYLLFMINLPDSLYVKFTTPMQSLAAELGVQMLPLVGIDAMREGTTLTVGSGVNVHRLNVAEACSGMRMLMAFVALAVVLAYSTTRPMWEKIFLAGCAVPVAIFCNALRVAFTGWLAVKAGKDYTQGSTHEYVGFLMLLPAMAIQLSIGWVLDRMFIEVPEESGGRAGGVA